MSFWHGGAGLSFVALLWENVFCVGASGRKARYGPLVNFKNVFNFDGYKIYEGSVVL